MEGLGNLLRTLVPISTCKIDDTNEGMYVWILFQINYLIRVILYLFSLLCYLFNIVIWYYFEYIYTRRRERILYNYKSLEPSGVHWT